MFLSPQKSFVHPIDTFSDVESSFLIYPLIEPAKWLCSTAAVNTRLDMCPVLKLILYSFGYI